MVDDTDDSEGTDWPMPDAWHCINIAGQFVQVTTDVRREIEAWLRSLEYPRDHFATVTVESIYGEELTLMADAINGFYDTTPELRRRARLHEQMLEQERTRQGFID